MSQPLYLTTLVTNAPAVLHLTQDDVGSVVQFMLRDTPIPAGASVGLWIEKPSGELSYNPGTVNGQTISIEILYHAVMELGTAKGQLWLQAAGEEIRTLTFPVKITEGA